nr:uncharacterized protein LOC123761363 isoform X2 [Procambarus clarkii]
MWSSQRHADSVRTIFQTILKEHGGGICLDNLTAEYEIKAGRKLNLNELGFNSIPDLLSSFAEIFRVIRQGDKHFVCDSNYKVFMDSESKEVSPVNGIRRKLDQECIERLKKLLEEFPDGLSTDELIGAYRGFYGATLDDLNPETYGYKTLEALLKCHPEVISIRYWDGKIIILANTSIFPHISNQGEPLSCPMHVAGVHDSYKTLEEKSLLLVGQMVDLVVGEVYSPSRFWVIHKGRNTSQALNSLMDCMFEFYSSRLGERYVIPEEKVTIRAPVIALHEEDMNFYRAFIVSLEDLRTVKLFFVDYGTVCQCDYSCLRLVHKKFFTLPAQAMKAVLSDVIPSHGRKSWGREASQRFLELVQNKAVIGHIVSLKGAAYMNLWDTNSQEDINIGDILIAEGWASPSHPASIDVLGQPDSSVTKASYSSSEKLIVQCTDPVINTLNPVENSSISINLTPVVSLRDTFTQSAVSNPHGDQIANIDLVHDKHKNVPSCPSSESSHISLDYEQNVKSKYPTVTQSSPYGTAAFIENLCRLMNDLNLKSSRPDMWEPSQIPFSCTATPASPPPQLSTSEAPQKINLIHTEVPKCFQNTIQQLEIMSKTSTQVTEARKFSSVAPPPGFGPVPTNLQVTHEVREPSVSVRLVPYNSQTVASMGLQTSVTTSIDPPILSTGIDDIFYSDEDDDDDDVIMENLKSTKDYQKYQCVIKRVAPSASMMLHVIELNGKLFVISAEVSQLLNLDVHSLLQEKIMDFPSVILGKDSHANVYQQLIEYGCKAVYGSDGEILRSFIIYPATLLPRILQFLSRDKSKLLSTLKNLVDECASQDRGCFEKDTRETRCLISGAQDTIPSIPYLELGSQTGNIQDLSDPNNKLQNRSKESLEHLDEYLDISDTPDYEPSNSKGFSSHCKEMTAAEPQNNMLRKPDSAVDNYCSDSSSSEYSYDPSIRILNYSTKGVTTRNKTHKVQESKTLDKFPKEMKMNIEPLSLSEVPDRNTSHAIVQHVVTPVGHEKNCSVRPKEIQITRNINKETVKLRSNDCLQDKGECNSIGKFSLLSSEHARESAQLNKNGAISIPSKILEIKGVVPEESVHQSMNKEGDTSCKSNNYITQNKEDTLLKNKETTHEHKESIRPSKVQNELSKEKESEKYTSNLEYVECVREIVSASQSCSSEKPPSDRSGCFSEGSDALKKIILYQRKFISYLRQQNLAKKNHELICDLVDNIGKCQGLYERLLKSEPLNEKLQKSSDTQEYLKKDRCLSECDEVYDSDVDSAEKLFKRSDVDPVRNIKDPSGEKTIQERRGPLRRRPLRRGEDLSGEEHSGEERTTQERRGPLRRPPLRRGEDLSGEDHSGEERTTLKHERRIKDMGFIAQKANEDGKHMVKSTHYSSNAMKCALLTKDPLLTREAFDTESVRISTENQHNLQSTNSFMTTWVNNAAIGCASMTLPVYPQIFGYAQVIETHPFNFQHFIPVQNSSSCYLPSNLQKN